MEKEKNDTKMEEFVKELVERVHEVFEKESDNDR